MIIDTKVLRQAMAVKMMKKLEAKRRNVANADELYSLDKQFTGIVNESEKYISWVEDIFKQNKKTYNAIMQYKILGHNKIYWDLL